MAVGAWGFRHIETCLDLYYVRFVCDGLLLLLPLQVLLFGVLAIEIKRKAPGAHTICEIVKARWGTHAHIVFLCFCFMTNIIVTAMLLLGGSAVVNALTGMNLYAASFLIPLGVIAYTLHGGLKATFLASYLHSVIGMYHQCSLSFHLKNFTCCFAFFPPCSHVAWLSFHLLHTLIGFLSTFTYFLTFFPPSSHVASTGTLLLALSFVVVGSPTKRNLFHLKSPSSFNPMLVLIEEFHSRNF